MYWIYLLIRTRKNIQINKLLWLRLINTLIIVPFVESSKGKFLKTIIPSRKATREYLGGKMGEIKLDKEEKEILDSFERGEWKQSRKS